MNNDILLKVDDSTCEPIRSTDTHEDCGLEYDSSLAEKKRVKKKRKKLLKAKSLSEISNEVHFTICSLPNYSKIPDATTTNFYELNLRANLSCDYYKKCPQGRRKKKMPSTDLTNSNTSCFNYIDLERFYAAFAVLIAPDNRKCLFVEEGKKGRLLNFPGGKRACWFGGSNEGEHLETHILGIYDRHLFARK